MLSSGMTLVTSAPGSASIMAPSSSAVLTSVTPAHPTLQAKVLPQQIQGDASIFHARALGWLARCCIISVEIDG